MDRWMHAWVSDAQSRGHTVESYYLYTRVMQVIKKSCPQGEAGRPGACCRQAARLGSALAAIQWGGTRLVQRGVTIVAVGT